jgi:hypothetical protein
MKMTARGPLRVSHFVFPLWFAIFSMIPADRTSGASGQQTPQQRAASPAPAQAPPKGGQDAKVMAELSNPVIVWKMDSKKDPLTDEVTTKPSSVKFFLNTSPTYYVTISANCTNNGASVFFLAGASDKDPVPQYAWYVDQSDNSGEQVADVRMRVDDRPVHVAQGYPDQQGHTVYTNTLGLLFYEPNLVSRSTREQQDSATTGFAALDGLVGGMVKQAAQANAQKWADNSAGPLSDLLNATSIRVELPLTNYSQAILDLNPQDKVLHKFVSDCSAKFGGGSSRPAAQTAPAPQPIVRSSPAPTQPAPAAKLAPTAPPTPAAPRTPASPSRPVQSVPAAVTGTGNASAPTSPSSSAAGQPVRPAPASGTAALTVPPPAPSAGVNPPAAAAPELSPEELRQQRAAEAQKRTQKIKACAETYRQGLKDHPDAVTELAKEYAACLQAAR